MDKAFIFTVNGRQHKITTDPQRRLLEVLREDLGLTGTKYGCGEGQCGACTVLLDGKPSTSCNLSLEAAQGHEIVTIEGLAKGEKLHPVQKAFLTAGSFQCGYCTPGMILATVGLLRETPNATEEQIVAGLEKHLCRCCNYPGIASAIRAAVSQATTR